MVSYQQDLRLLGDGDSDTLFKEEIRKLIKASLLCGAFSAAYTLPRLSWETQLPTLSTEATLALVAGVILPVGGLVTAGSLARKWRADSLQLERKATLQGEKLRVPALEVARLGGWIPQPESPSGGQTTEAFDILRFMEKRSRRRAVGGMLKARKQMLRIDDNKEIVDAMNKAAKAESKVASLERRFQKEENVVDSHVAAEEHLRQAAENRAIKAQADVMECLGNMLLLEEEIGGDCLLSPQDEAFLAQGHTQVREELPHAVDALCKANANADAAEGDAERRMSEVKLARKKLLTKYLALSEELKDLLETTCGSDARGVDVQPRLAAAAEVCVAKLEAKDSSTVRKAIDECFQAKQKAETASAALAKVQANCAERLIVAETQRQRAGHARHLQNTELAVSEETRGGAEGATALDECRAEVTALRIEHEGKVDAEEKISARLEQELYELRAEGEAGRAKTKTDITAAKYRAEEMRTKAGAGCSADLDVLEGRCIALESEVRVTERRVSTAEVERERALRTHQESSGEFKNKIAEEERYREEAETRLKKLRATRETRAREDHETRVQGEAKRYFEELRKQEKARKLTEEHADEQLKEAKLGVETVQQRTTVEASKHHNQEATPARRGDEEACMDFETHAQRQRVDDGAKTEGAERKENTTTLPLKEGATSDPQHSGRTEADAKRTARERAKRTAHAEAEHVLKNEKIVALPLVSHEAERLGFVGESKSEAVEEEPKYEEFKSAPIAELQLEGEREQFTMVQHTEQLRLRQETWSMPTEESTTKSETPRRETEPATRREDGGTATLEVKEGDHTQNQGRDRMESLNKDSRRHEECTSKAVDASTARQEPIGRKLREEESSTNFTPGAEISHVGPLLARSVHTLNPPPGLSPYSAASPAHTPNISLPATEERGFGGGFGFHLEPSSLTPATVATGRTHTTGSLQTPRLPPGLVEGVGIIGGNTGAGQEGVGAFVECDLGGNGGRVGGGSQQRLNVPSRGQTDALEACKDRENVAMGGGLGHGACGGEDVAAEGGAYAGGEGEEVALRELLERAGCLRHLPRFVQEQMDFEAAGYMSEALLTKFGLNEVCVCVHLYESGVSWGV